MKSIQNPLRNGWKNRNLILASLDWTRPKDPPTSLGSASILAHLNDKKIDVQAKSWSVNHDDFSDKKVSNFILENSSSNTDVALGAFVWNEKHIQNILNDLRKNNYQGNIILGGPQVSYVKRGLEKYYPQADVFVRGYGEEALANLYLSNQPFPAIEGVHFANQKDLGKSANADLEKLSSPFLTGLIEPQKFIRWETQRGCPFRCSFCQHRESDVTQKRRHFQLSRVLEEADWITQNPIVQDVAVLDPTFNSGSQYLDILDRLIEGEFSGKLALQVRIEMIKPEFLEKVEQLNKTGRVVLEGGIQTIHKSEQKLIQRPNNMKKIVSIFEDIKSKNIETELSLIFGLPGQTVDSFQQSIDFCKEVGGTKIFAFPLMLLRGTPLHHSKELLGLVESNDINLESINRVQTDIPHVVESRSFNYEQWQQMAQMAEDLSQYNEPKNPSSITKNFEAEQLEGMSQEVVR